MIERFEMRRHMQGTADQKTATTASEGANRRDIPGEPEEIGRTATVPQVTPSPRSLSASETGVVATVNAEEQPEVNDTQDADVTDGKTESTPETATDASKAEAPKQPVILIVEDTTELAEVIQATLERMKMTTYHETHGSGALDVLDNHHPDLVLLDISLPDMTGWHILDKIKEKAEAAPDSMPIVIVISAYGDPANRLVGKLQGIHSYLIKPFTADEVEKAVTEALHGAAK